MWKYGLSPFKEDNHEERECANETDNGVVEGTGESNASGNNLSCAFYGCKLKAMALTSFCHLHILSDSKQQLYKPCDYVIKRFLDSHFSLFSLLICGFLNLSFFLKSINSSGVPID